MTRRQPCTGVSASWCPNHGDCRCPNHGDGGWPGDRNDDDCPLHSSTSDHAEQP